MWHNNGRKNGDLHYREERKKSTQEVEMGFPALSKSFSLTKVQVVMPHRKVCSFKVDFTPLYLDVVKDIAR